MRRRNAVWTGRTAAVAAVLALVGMVSVRTQSPQIKVMERHVSGQTLAPIFEGWALNPDGTSSLYFGYLNRNYEEELDIPIGPNNSFEPDVDQGQPTHFLPRRHKMAFAIVVPKDFGDKKTFTWTLTIRGNTEKVAGSLNKNWQVDVAKDTETGNTPPVVKVGANQTITLPQTATLTATVTDDGLPKPRKPRADQKPNALPPPGVMGDTNIGLTVEWGNYRGPGKVTFSPPTQPVAGGKVSTTATFSAPGDYIVQMVADDGSRIQGYHCCWTNGFIKVSVRPAGGTTGGRQ